MIEVTRALEIEVETYQETIRLLTGRLADAEKRADFDKAQHEADKETLNGKIEELSMSCIQAVKRLQACETDKAEATDKLGKKTVECRDLRNERDELQRESTRHLIIAKYLCNVSLNAKKDTFKVPHPTKTKDGAKVSAAILTFSLHDDFETIVRNIDELYNVMADFEIEALLKV